MATDHRAELARIQRFDQLVSYLRDEMGWPIASDDFEELTFDYTPEELGINAENAAKIEEIKRLRPLSARQPWGIFFVKFEPKNLPVVALRRVLSQVAIKKRTSANAADRAGWEVDDLLFVSNYGQGGERQISFAHFARPRSRQDLPTLKVLGWDNRDTPLHLDAIAKELTENLAWPRDENDVDEWRRRWGSAFTLGHREVITTAERLSIRLAELAGAIRDRIRSAVAIESPRGPLTMLMKAFQESLVHDLDTEGFADMYAQTISYGLLSSRIADPTKKTADDFAAHMRTSPFLRELMQTFLKIGGRQGKSDGAGIDFDELGVADVVELLDGANMEAVLRDFGDRNRQEDPVIHFFEGFLQAYDKKIRKDRGVFYTPQPVVSYIVRSVHELLQTEFGLADGLADTATWGAMLKKHPAMKLPPLTAEPNETRTISPDEPFVQILDPATGTATFLVEVIAVIHHTLCEKWSKQRLTDAQRLAAWNDYVPLHLLPRLHAFELMMAPYAIAHMKIGLKLAETGYCFDTEERARVYLTNALEPWAKQLPLIGIDALAHEAAAVNEIKRHKRFTVVIGNPPYSGEGMNKGEWVRSLIETYMYVDGIHLGEKGKKNWLQDDYVKFIRFSQLEIDTSRFGILGFINNHSCLDNPTFRGMRSSLISSFQNIRVLNLHGSSGKRERCPDGSVDENVFDIQQGVAIDFFARTTKSESKNSVAHADLWGVRGDVSTNNPTGKYGWLMGNSYSSTIWKPLIPSAPFYLFVPQDIALRDEYNDYWKLTDVMPHYGAGIITSRDHFVIDFDDDPLLKRIEQFHDGTISDEWIRTNLDVKDNSMWSMAEARKNFRKHPINHELIADLLYRPLDKRRIYFETNVVFNMRIQVMRHMLAGRNIGLLTARSNKSPTPDHFFCSKLMVETKCGESTTQSSFFPLFLYPSGRELTFGNQRQVNLSPAFLAATKNITTEKGDSAANAEDIFHYAYAVFHSPGYRSRYAEFLKIDFPRLPLTGNLELFRALARLGDELTALHLLESPKLDKPRTEFIGSSREVVKVGWIDNTVWINAGGKKAATTAGSCGFQGVPESVWNFHIGGYQVCEKWLKDRKGRTLTDEDLAHYQKIVVALSETIRLMEEIDKVIDLHGGWPGAFSGQAAA